MFWKRKKNDFISLNLNTPDEPVVETKPEPVVEAKPAPVIETKPEPVVEAKPVTPPPLPPPIAAPELNRVPAPELVKSAPPKPVVAPPAPPVPTPVAEETDEDDGFMKRFRKAISSTRENIASRIEDVVKGKKQIDAATLEDLEEALISADIGVQTTMEIIENVRKQVDRQTLKDADELKRTIKQNLLDILEKAEKSRGVASETSVPDDVRPYVMMIVGVNGVGKTTTIGKLAQRIKAEGNEILICAADTFRAAASDQLAIWAERAGVPLIQQKQGTDPAAVLFDSLKAAKARNADVLIVDTAGRLHNKANLMAELEKMKRIANREVPGAPHEVLLVVDAVTGQNGLSQAREFMKAADITGLVLTKLDGTAKGGIAVAIAKELNLPIRYCGIGEKADDLVVFDPRAYVEGLFE
ncbi:MAG TPA: signal recognition particle-docking protein FtsY [Blastocatellia bacterium]|nr:signal recognition particle-docking protein FtsY [Blastocatellia bacterium]HNG29493.1 signal recognition particle-docking protein FtsY [Blastocatellia bacterium]